MVTGADQQSVVLLERDGVLEALAGALADARRSG
jgi:hypothetical protein